ncbi:hypothetical protein ACFQ4A_11270 [Lentibacillus salinarum]|uniref:Uncharacterized protein n=1 Tax=Lentibacillus salinarum TaxID=446820 RepID=A0ABW3ZVI1_9BACI
MLIFNGTTWVSFRLGNIRKTLTRLFKCQSEVGLEEIDEVADFGIKNVVQHSI